MKDNEVKLKIEDLALKFEAEFTVSKVS